MVQVRQVISGTPPVTGVSSLRNLTDVNDSDKTNGSFVVWNAFTQKHEYYVLDDNFAIDSENNIYNFIPTVLDSAAVNTLITDATIDSAAVLAVVAGAEYTKVDSADVSSIITADVDATFVQALQDKAFSSITGTPTTLSGYGITDALALAGGTMSGDINLGSNDITNGGTITAAALTAAGITYPSLDGTTGQAIITDGNGNLTFAFAGGEGDSAGVSSMRDLSDVIATLNNDRAEGHYLKFDSALDIYVSAVFDSDALSAAKAGFSATDAGGFGSFTYADGEYTYTGPSVSDIRSQFSAIGNISYDSATGQFSISTYSGFDSDLAASTTSDLSEGTNLYYTSARFDSDLGSKSTDDISEGENLYYTAARFNTAFSGKTSDDLAVGSTNLYYTSALFNASLGTKSTSDLAEGTNLYYTTARADSAATDLVTRAFVKALGIDLDDVTDNSATTTNSVAVADLTTTAGSVTHDVTATTITSDSLTVINNTAHDSDFRSVEFLLQANDDSAGESQITKILATYDKSSVASTEYGTVFTGDSDLGTYTVDLSGDNIRLLFQRRPSNTITLKTTKTIIQ